MKIRPFLVPRAILLIVLFSGYFISGACTDDPEQLLEWYLETGAFEYAEKIKNGFPGSPYDGFCDAWVYKGANNEMARELGAKLVKEHPEFAPGHFLMGTVLTTGFNKYREAKDIFQFFLNRSVIGKCGPTNRIAYSLAKFIHYSGNTYSYPANLMLLDLLGRTNLFN